MITSLTKLKQYYESFDQASFDNLEDIYADDVVFTDPLHEINGVEALKKYFKGICSNLTSNTPRPSRLPSRPNFLDNFWQYLTLARMFT